MISNRKALLRWAAGCLATFKTFTDWAKEGVIILSQVPKRSKKEPRPVHELAYAKGREMFVCSRCCQGAGTKLALSRKSCTAIPDQRMLQLQGMAALGHEVVCLGECMVFCNKCGSYAEGGAGRNLKLVCSSVKSTQLVRLPALRKGKHPLKKHYLGEMMPLYFLARDKLAQQLPGPNELQAVEDKKVPAPGADFEASLEEEDNDLQAGRDLWGEDFWMQ